MSAIRILSVAAVALAFSAPAAMARDSYLASDWSDLIAKVNCKDVVQHTGGQWQISAEVSFAGNLKSDPFVPDADVSALKKKCPAAATAH